MTWLASNYPGGFANGITIRGMSVLNMHPNRVFWVDSNNNGSNNNPGTFDKPFATIAYAASTACSANRGDIVMVKPLHAETITAATTVMSLAGVSVIGLGVGNQRPTLTFTTATTAAFAITANDCYVENIRFVGNFANIVAAITTTKKNTWINNCEFSQTSTILNFLSCVAATSTTTGDSDGLRVTNSRFISASTSDLAMITIAGTCDNVFLSNNTMISKGTASPLVTCAAGKILTNSEIAWNRVVNAMTANELFISNDGTTNTGIIHNNYVGHADVTGTHDPGWDAGGWRLFNNLSTSVDNLQGLTIPTTDVNL